MSSLLDLCRDLPERTLQPGDVLLAEGARSGRLYILASGEVEVLKGTVEVPTIAEPGAIFGELSALLDIPHTASVRARTPCRVYVIERVDEFLQSNRVIAYQLARLLAQRLHTVTTYLVDLKNQFKEHEGHLGMVDEVLHNLMHQQVEECAPGSDREPEETM